jgi:1-aminocyclopropane-1-carboxylate deaminase
MVDPQTTRLDDLSQWAPSGSCSIQMLRLDLLHPVVSGNKWFKLKYHLEAALTEGKDTLLTYGGGFSNHLVATACAAKEQGLRSVGLVRGNYSGRLTPTLQACADYGMRLEFLPRVDFATASNHVVGKPNPLIYVIPEGGAGDEGEKGAGEIANMIPSEATDACVPVGTGTTLRGLLAALPEQVRVHGFYVARDIERMLPLERVVENSSRLQIHPVSDPRFGKWRQDAVQFIRNFYAATGIPLDVVYTSKMMMKVEELLKTRSFDVSSRLVCIHTGGLLGNPAGLMQ